MGLCLRAYMCMQDRHALDANQVYHIKVCAVPVGALAPRLQDTSQMQSRTDRRDISEIGPVR
jgi:hypothetical protein